MLLLFTMDRHLNVDQIRKLWILSLIIKQRSLKKAALEAQVSPSAISQTLSSLEKAFGKKLAVRERGTITPTAEAVHLLRAIQPAFEIFQKLESPSETLFSERGWLNFGTYESIAMGFFPALTVKLRQSFPHLRLGLRIARTNQLITMVRKGELCTALITETDNLENLHVELVARDRLGFYVSRRGPIASLGWAAVEQYGLGMLSSPKDGYPSYIKKFLSQLEGLKPSVVSDSFETLRGAAAAGAIVAVLPQRVALRANGLKEIQPPGTPAAGTSGRHKILLIRPVDCNQDEGDFLFSEVKTLFS